MEEKKYNHFGNKVDENFLKEIKDIYIFINEEEEMSVSVGDIVRNMIIKEDLNIYLENNINASNGALYISETFFKNTSNIEYLLKNMSNELLIASYKTVVNMIGEKYVKPIWEKESTDNNIEWEYIKDNSMNISENQMKKNKDKEGLGEGIITFGLKKYIENKNNNKTYLYGQTREFLIELVKEINKRNLVDKIENKKLETVFAILRYDYITNESFEIAQIMEILDKSKYIEYVKRIQEEHEVEYYQVKGNKCLQGYYISKIKRAFEELWKVAKSRKENQKEIVKYMNTRIELFERYIEIKEKEYPKQKLFTNSYENFKSKIYNERKKYKIANELKFVKEWSNREEIEIMCIKTLSYRVSKKEWIGFQVKKYGKSPEKSKIVEMLTDKIKYKSQLTEKTILDSMTVQEMDDFIIVNTYNELEIPNNEFEIISERIVNDLFNENFHQSIRLQEIVIALEDELYIKRTLANNEKTNKLNKAKLIKF